MNQAHRNPLPYEFAAEPADGVGFAVVVLVAAATFIACGVLGAEAYHHTNARAHVACATSEEPTHDQANGNHR